MPLFNPQLGGIAVEHLTRRIRIGAKEILVFDDLFDRRTLATMYAFLRRAGFRWIVTDSPKNKTGLKWQLRFADRGAQAPFFSDVVELVKSVCGTAPMLAEVYANFNLYGESFQSHIDARHGVTALVCANLEWRQTWHGETVFYERGEPAYLVLPRPGRVTLFDASLGHRGSPPARDCYEPRLNVVFKFKARRKRRNSGPHRPAQWLPNLEGYIKKALTKLP
jgi:hypothetical protein